MSQGEAYATAYERPFTTDDERRCAASDASTLLRETSIRLRVQELRAPVLRKVRRKIEYNTQRALEQCEVALDLATETGDAKTILKAVELQARLTKLLSEEINVNHRHGLLDDASTEVLLLMKKEAEVRRARQKLLASSIVIEGQIESADPQGAPLEKG